MSKRILARLGLLIIVLFGVMAGTIHVMRRGKIIETLEHPKSFSDFQEPYSQELVKAVRSKRRALQ